MDYRKYRRQAMMRVFKTILEIVLLVAGILNLIVAYGFKAEDEMPLATWHLLQSSFMMLMYLVLSRPYKE